MKEACDVYGVIVNMLLGQAATQKHCALFSKALNMSFHSVVCSWLPKDGSVVRVL